MKAEKDKQKKKLSTIKEDLKTTRKLAGAETLKAYELFHYFVVGEEQMQWDKFFQEMHSKDPWVGIDGQSHKGLCVQSWLSSRTASSSTSSLSSLLVLLRSSISICSIQ
jgi:hypothetical protein